MDHIKTVCGSESSPFSVLISSKSVGKIGRKSTFEIRKKKSYRAVFNTRDFWKISNSDFSPILPADFDDIKTENAYISYPQTVLIWSKSAGKIGGKSLFEICKKSMY